MKDSNFLKENNARSMWHPMAHPADSLANPPTIVTGAQGVRITDIDGHEVVDAVGGLWNVNLGFSCAAGQGRHRRAAGPSALLLDLSRHLQRRGDRTVRGTARLLRARRADPRLLHLGRIGQRRNRAAAGAAVSQDPGRGGGASSSSASRRAITAPISAAPRSTATPISAPRTSRCWPAATTSPRPIPIATRSTKPIPAKLAQLCLAALEDEIAFQGADTIAAFIMEPILGAGGVIPPHASFMPGVREICTPPRHPADRGRGDHRLRPHRKLVRHRASGACSPTSCAPPRRSPTAISPSAR